MASSSAESAAGTGPDRHPPHKQRRVKTGCLTCRIRKVKCDETAGACLNCAKLQLQCQWGAAEGSSGGVNVVASSVSSLRPSACIACRLARCRCSHDKPCCKRCANHNLQCHYPSKRRRRRPLSTQSPGQVGETVRTPSESDDLSPHGVAEIPNPLPHQAQSLGHVNGHVNGIHAISAESPVVGRDHGNTTAGSFNSPAETPPSVVKFDLPRGERLEQLVGTYFLHVHPYQANAFLHRSTILQAVRTGELPRVVLLAICAVSARFVDPPDPSSAKRWADAAATDIILSYDVSVDNVTAAVLLATHALYSGAFKQAHTLCGVAIRQATALSLHRELPSDKQRSWVESEGRRRLFFACYCLERMMSNGLPESTQCLADRVRIQLPCDGISYRLAIKTETPVPILEGNESQTPFWLYKNLGTVGNYIRIMGIRHMIQRYLYDIAEDLSSHSPPWEPTSQFSTCVEKLAAFRASLTSAHRITLEVIVNRYDAPIFGSLVMLYLWWNMCHVELYRVTLSGYPQSLDSNYLALAPLDWAPKVQSACLQHAKAMTSLLELIVRHVPDKSFTIRDPNVAHLVYTSLRVQLEDPNRNTEEIQKQFDLILGLFEKASKLFEPVRSLLRETCAMMARHGLHVLPATLLISRGGSPQPWFQAQQRLDLAMASASSTRAQMTVADESGEQQSSVSALLPDAMGMGDWMSGWTPEFESMFGISAVSGGRSGVRPHHATTASEVYNLSNDPERWQGKMSELPVYGMDPFLPEVMYTYQPNDTAVTDRQSPPASAGLAGIHSVDGGVGQQQSPDAALANWLAPLLHFPPPQEVPQHPDAWQSMRWDGA